MRTRYTDTNPMPRNPISISLTKRDLELLNVLTRGPYWTDHLLRISQRFDAPFPSLRYLQKRLSALNAAGFIRSFSSVTLMDHPPRYHKLTRDGWRLVRGEAPPPTKRFFLEAKPLTQLHQRYLIDFVVHTDLAAYREGAQLCNYEPDNSVRITFPTGSLVPDASFDIVTTDGKTLHYFVELDNSTERLRTTADVESWVRKIHLYDALRDRSAEPFRVLVVTTKSVERLENILDVAHEQVRNKARPLFAGVFLGDYEQELEPLTIPMFRMQHRTDLVEPLIQTHREPKNAQTSMTQLLHA